mmetsp:Transcript_37164/g.83288  ORF Transcript_37164/g.83288 Transcript_37164/m.83288 type:complete len:201 (-) Transcript_37164:380-982(-)
MLARAPRRDDRSTQRRSVAQPKRVPSLTLSDVPKQSQNRLRPLRQYGVQKLGMNGRTKVIMLALIFEACRVLGIVPGIVVPRCRDPQSSTERIPRGRTRNAQALIRAPRGHRGRREDHRDRGRRRPPEALVESRRDTRIREPLVDILQERQDVLDFLIHRDTRSEARDEDSAGVARALQSVLQHSLNRTHGARSLGHRRR